MLRNDNKHNKQNRVRIYTTLAVRPPVAAAALIYGVCKRSSTFMLVLDARQRTCFHRRCEAKKCTRLYVRRCTSAFVRLLARTTPTDSHFRDDAGQVTCEQ